MLGATFWCKKTCMENFALFISFVYYTLFMNFVTYYIPNQELQNLKKKIFSFLPYCLIDLFELEVSTKWLNMQNITRYEVNCRNEKNMRLNAWVILNLKISAETRSQKQINETYQNLLVFEQRFFEFQYKIMV